MSPDETVNEESYLSDLQLITEAMWKKWSAETQLVSSPWLRSCIQCSQYRSFSWKT